MLECAMIVCVYFSLSTSVAGQRLFMKLTYASVQMFSTETVDEDMHAKVEQKLLEHKDSGIKPTSPKTFPVH